MGELRIWDAALVTVVSITGFFLKSRLNDLDRISLLLNKTREEVARDNVTRAEYRQDMQNVLDKLDRLNDKLDALIKEKHHV